MEKNFDQYQKTIYQPLEVFEGNQREQDIQACLLIVENRMQMKVFPIAKESITIGRINTLQKNDLEFQSKIVSAEHGKIICTEHGYYYQDMNSLNGTYVNGERIRDEKRSLREGTVLKIDGSDWFSEQYKELSVLMIFTYTDYSKQKWNVYPLAQRCRTQILVGRDVPEGDLQLQGIRISRKHGMFKRVDHQIMYFDLQSAFGSMVNGMPLKKGHIVKEKDVFQLATVTMFYTDGLLLFNSPKTGCSLRIRNLTKVVSQKNNIFIDLFHRQKKEILSHVNVDIEPSDFVAVLGTSGAGKSTFLNCVNGYEKATEGAVYLNGKNLYKNKKIVKKQIGYVPQEDLLRDGLSVIDTLCYIAKLRLPVDVSCAEREERIHEVLDILGLDEACQMSDIRKISGGQRKRVSIACELISDPPLLFLDEPTSGLDPETETVLMKQLYTLSRKHEKTIIVITHTLQNIWLFDKILFLGPGGKVCFFGSPKQALRMFQVDSVIDMYALIREHADYYAAMYQKQYQESHNRKSRQKYKERAEIS